MRGFQYGVGIQYLDRHESDLAHSLIFCGYINLCMEKKLLELNLGLPLIILSNSHAGETAECGELRLVPCGGWVNGSRGSDDCSSAPKGKLDCCKFGAR